MMSRRRLFPALVLVLVLKAASSAQEVSFRKDLAPLLHRRCAGCHGEESSKGGYRLDTFARLRKAGDSELSPVTAGKPEESELYRLLIEPDPHDRMPQKADALPAQEIALVERWVREGAPYDGGSEDRRLVELARETLLQPAPQLYSRPAPVTALTFSPDGKQLVVSGYYEVTLWNLDGTQLVRRIGGLPERVNSIAWHPSERLLAIGGGSPGMWGTVMLVNLADDDKVQVLCDLTDAVQSVAFSPDGNRLVAGCGDRTVRVFATASGKEERVLKHHADWVQSVAFQSAGKFALSSSRDRTVRVFDAATGEVESAYQGHSTPVTAAAFTPDGARAVSSSGGREVHLWNTRNGERRSLIKDLSSRVQQLLAGRLGVVASTADCLIHVFQLSGRHEFVTLVGHGDQVQALALSPDEQWIASGSQDGEVLLWSMHCGTWVQRWTPSPIR
jgi:WD40 repeat protein/mono/diheme cytochrome c family protein